MKLAMGHGWNWPQNYRWETHISQQHLLTAASSLGVSFWHMASLSKNLETSVKYMSLLIIRVFQYLS